ncbi:PaaI family thioesterase [Novosphingobium malaysiense]|uniref:Thioesterase domain-containing protein n=1 Tax=Novosphingobium malaysiense TaxID=1348853 RepID=A0A0B1ZIE7_9SPHN|nr:PaaI family thioesterase [Novosphingobium malaysiense]KHK90292.1 hypothetical protein LK12_16850 [Novosphingobium malaysiense]
MANLELHLPTYAQTIGIGIDRWETGSPVLGIDYKPEICGNPGMLHGGAVSTLLEVTAIASLDAELRSEHGPVSLTPLNSTIQFLRAAGEGRTFASATVVKAGRRLANVAATVWQDTPDKPVATAVVNVALAPRTAE